ncbi:MAG: pyrimidine dimer DNA glycosylase/endonuclease V [bacterium]
MRIWSLHPKYLDTKGLVALWRETLLAKNVLAGNTKGYKNHPQLLRFKNTKNSLDGINQYLSEVFHEATRRNYNFDRKKIDWGFKPTILTVTQGQVEYEKNHLLKKLQTRDLKKFEEIKTSDIFNAHPIFEVVEGGIEEWEIL